MRRLSKVCRAVSRDIRYRKMDRRTWRAAGRGQARLAYMNGQKMMIWYNINSSLWHFKNLYCFFFTTRSSSVSPPPQASYVLAQLYIFVCTNTHNTAVFGKTKTKQNNPPQKTKCHINNLVTNQAGFAVYDIIKSLPCYVFNTILFISDHLNIRNH